MLEMYFEYQCGKTASSPSDSLVRSSLRRNAFTTRSTPRENITVPTSATRARAHREKCVHWRRLSACDLRARPSPTARFLPTERAKSPR